VTESMHSPACTREIRPAEGKDYYEMVWQCVYNCPVAYGKDK